MKGTLRWAAIFLASLLAARLVEAFLTSGAGKNLLRKTGSTALLSEEGIDVVTKYSREAVTLVLDTLLSRTLHTHAETKPESPWLNLVENTSYVITAIGALMRLGVDFWRERMQLRT